MPKIVINTENFANEQTLSDVLSAASQANANNSAEVIRDSNGKVVKVLVNLPSNTPSQGIATATAAISAHSAVAATVSFPIGNGVAETFEGYADNFAFNEYTAVSVSGTKVRFENSKVTASGITGKSATGVSYFQRITLHASDNNLLSIKSLECEYDFKAPTATSGHYHNIRGRNNQPIRIIAMENGTWQIYDPNIVDAPRTNTGLTANDLVHIKCTMNSLGDFQLNVGNSTVTASELPSDISTLMIQDFQSNPDNSVGLIDNLKVTINDGSL